MIRPILSIPSPQAAEHLVKELITLCSPEFQREFRNRPADESIFCHLRLDGTPMLADLHLTGCDAFMVDGATGKPVRVKLPDPYYDMHYDEYSYEKEPLLAALKAAGVEVEP